ncbi:hypothetical protein DID75_00790 [Candidatus Marinamargulisbacteria bacterium SCGC AG-410-N11]|nr:hypothetical protein DID75_00790 [Candidatus Marinamargulisbacteria bacterium SCGC AG-410-N11]
METNLLFLLVGLFTFNTIFSIILWYFEKSRLFKLLTFSWAVSLIPFVAQGLFNSNHLEISLSYSSLIIPMMFFAYLMADITEVKFKIKPFIILYCGSVILSIWFNILNFPFWAISVPVCITISLPCLWVTGSIISKRKKLISPLELMLCFTCIILFFHNMDFPFIRLIDELAPFGFTVAILIVFSQSILLPTLILEKTSKEKARIETTIQTGHNIQSEIIPDKIQVPGLDIASFMKPSDEIGGDYYDSMEIDGRYWVFIGDVTGHGIGSGLVMFMIQSIISTILKTHKYISPGKLNFIANQILYDNLKRLKEKTPMTIVSMCFEGQYKATFSGCHDNIFIYRADEKCVEIIHPTHFMVGLGFTNQYEGETYEEEKVEFKKDDILFLGTDGVSEAPEQGSYNKGFFGEDRIIQFLKNNSELSANKLKQKLISELDKFTDKNYYDDITFIFAKVS